MAGASATEQTKCDLFLAFGIWGDNGTSRSARRNAR